MTPDQPWRLIALGALIFGKWRPFTAFAGAIERTSAPAPADVPYERSR